MNSIHQQSPFRWWTSSRSFCSHLILGWVLSSLLSHLSPWCLAEDSFLLKAVVGEAKIYNEDVAAAQLRAERVALNRAVEQALGLNLQRRRLSEEGILLRDILHANSNGYAQVIRRGDSGRSKIPLM